METFIKLIILELHNVNIFITLTVFTLIEIL